jgi:hypothetical protein
MNAPLHVLPATEPQGRLRTLLSRAKRGLVSWLLADVKLDGMRFGKHSVVIGDLITMDTQAPASAGQVGMNATTGRIQVYIGGSARDVPGAHEVLLADGTVAMSGDLDANSNKITGLATPTDGSNDAATASWVADQITAAVDALEFADGVDAATTTAIAGSATLDGATLTSDSNGAFPSVDSLSPALNQTYMLKDEGNTKNGIWTLTQVGDGSNPWILTRRSDFAVSDAVAARIIPVKFGSTYGGSDWRVSSASGSDVIGTDAVAFTQRVVTNDHGSLVGLTDDDHSQYFAHAGRSGGQSLRGGTDANDNLIIDATTNATKGEIRYAAGNIVKMMGDDQFKPETSGEGAIGTTGNKFGEVNAVVVRSGDARFTDPNDESNVFNIWEHSDGTLRLTGLKLGRTWTLGHNGRAATDGELARAVAPPEDIAAGRV